MLSAEIEAMRSAVKKGKSRYAHRDSTLILLIYRHGLRVAEASALQWTQIDFNGGTIYVKQVKKGTPSVQPLYGDEIRSLRKLQRDYPPSPCVFQSSRSGPLAVAACNHKPQDLQSSHFQTRINCNYKDTQTRINCN